MVDHKAPGQYVCDGVVLPGIVSRDVLEMMKQGFTFNDSDVIIASYPKSGTTWLIEMVYLILTNGDTETARQVLQETRVPYLEATSPRGKTGFDAVMKTKPPRLIKTHLPYKYIKKSLEQTDTKLIVGMRNPKDTLVSYYYFYRMNASLGKFRGTWDEFYGLFHKNRLAYGDWFDYTNGYWRLRSQSNVFIVKYEEMIEDLQRVVENLARFLGKELNQETLQKIVKYGSFEEMKENSAVNKTRFGTYLDQDIGKFMRKGEVGDWKNHFSGAQSAQIDEMYVNRVAGKGLQFKYEIPGVKSKL